MVDNRVAAWVGGLVAAFAPSVANHAPFHPNLTAQFLVPVIVWRVVKLRDAPVRGGLILAGLVVWQVFINEETLLVTALAIGVFGLLWLVQRPREVRLPNVLAGLGVTLLVTAVLLAYPLWWQFFGANSYRGGAKRTTAFHTDLLGLTSFSRNSVAVRFSEFQPVPGFSAEQDGYFGWPLVIAVVAVVVWRWREPIVRSVAITGAVFAVLSFGNELTLHGRDTGVPGLYALLEHLPLFDTLLPTRLGEAATWAVAPLVADRAGPAAGSGGPAGAEGRPGRGGAGAGAPVPIKVIDRPAIPSFIASGEWRSDVRAQESVLVGAPGHLRALDADELGDRDRDRPAHVARLLPGPGRRRQGHRARRWAHRVRPTDRLINAATDSHQVPTVTDADREQARLDLAYWRTSIILAPPGGGAPPQRGTLDALFGPGREVGGLLAVGRQEHLTGRRAAVTSP